MTVIHLAQVGNSIEAHLVDSVYFDTHLISYSVRTPTRDEALDRQLQYIPHTKKVLVLDHDRDVTFYAFGSRRP